MCAFVTLCGVPSSVEAPLVHGMFRGCVLGRYLYSSSQKSASKPLQCCTLQHSLASPNCLGIMSQLITGDYVIKFERNSLRAQLSARDITICFASAQPKTQVRGGKWRCGLSLSSSAVSVKVKESNSNHSWALASDCRGLLVAQALL